MNPTLTEEQLLAMRARRLGNRIPGASGGVPIGKAKQPVAAFSAPAQGLAAPSHENGFGGVPGLTAEEESWLDPEFVRLLAQANAAGFSAGFAAGVAAGVAAARKGGVR